LSGFIYGPLSYLKYLLDSLSKTIFVREKKWQLIDFTTKVFHRTSYKIVLSQHTAVRYSCRMKLDCVANPADDALLPNSRRSNYRECIMHIPTSGLITRFSHSNGRPVAVIFDTEHRLHTCVTLLSTPYQRNTGYICIQKDGLNFVSLCFKFRTSDKYDVNYI